MLKGLSVVRQAFERVVRIVPTARLRDSVLLGLVDQEDLSALAEIEGATSGRLLAQMSGTRGLKPEELVSGVPHAAHINAAFAYAKPNEPNRFNGPDRGAWYSALGVDTCLQEVAFHMTEFLSRTGAFETSVDYGEMHASLAGLFVDLRNHKDNPCLDPDPAIGYLAGNALAREVIEAGHNGIIYPSVRHEGGTCIVALRPAAVQSVAQGAVHRLTWSGSPTPTVEKNVESTDGERTRQ